MPVLAPDLVDRLFRSVVLPEPGISRVRSGNGFLYRDHTKTPIEDVETLERIRALAIPPAWRNVWICYDPRGHLQATGRDAKRRTQYRYHPEWRRLRDAAKFDEMLEFARALPTLREQVRSDLRRRTLGWEQVLAAAVRLLDLGAFRSGSEEYTAKNDSYGLATLKRRHVHLGPGARLVFDYLAKSKQQRSITVTDRAVHSLVKQIFAHDPDGERFLSFARSFPDGVYFFDVRAEDVNDYLRRAVGSSFSAKDFRTWNATVLAASSLAAQGEPPDAERARARAISVAVKETARHLGNTAAVCRSSYIDPRIFEHYHAGRTISESLALERPCSQTLLEIHRGFLEEAVLELLDGGSLLEALMARVQQLARSNGHGGAARNGRSALEPVAALSGERY